MNPTSRTSASSISAPSNVIDVDEVYMKYEFDPEEDGIFSLDANTFRQSVRRSEGRVKVKDKLRQSAAEGSAGPRASQTPITTRQDSVNGTGPQKVNAGALANTHSGRVTQKRAASGRPSLPITGTSGGINHPSELGAAIKRVRQKRSMSNTPQPAEASASQKRRRLEGTTPAGNTWDEPIAGPSRLVHATAITTTPPIPRPKNIGPSPKRRFEVIELSSDGEEVVELLTPRKKNKLKQSNSPVHHFSPIEISSDDDIDMGEAFRFDDLPEPENDPEPEMPLSDDDGWDWDTIGDICDSERWNTTLTYTEEEDDVNIDLEQLQIDGSTRQTPPPTRYIHPDTSKWNALPPYRSSSGSIEFIWDKLRTVPNLHFRPRARDPMHKPIFVRPWKFDFPVHSLKCEHSFKKAPGSINRIEQSGEWTAIGSASIGGLPDVENAADDGSSAYNRPGSLLTWRKGLDIPSGHTLKKSVDPASGTPVFKYYAVHDVKFDPHSVAFASTGADRRLRIWTLADESEDDEQTPALSNMLEPHASKSRWVNSDTKVFGRTPYDIVFNPESSMLAVAEKKVNIFKITEEGQESHSFLLHGKREPHIIGSMAWGVGPTTDKLFVSSEPNPDISLPEACFDGVHKMYCPEKERFIIEFDAKEAGDTMAVNAKGSILALSTCGAEERHILRLYDVKRQRERALATIHLKRFPKRYENYEGEVSCAAFSPDGIFLAMARNDNHVHVYDVRMLHRGPIFDYEHFGESRAASRESVYGVVKVHWMHSEQTRRMALVSGGEDGCVRLWNPMHSGENEDNGKAVAFMNSDIGSFSVGDPFEGEHRLVVGDSAGEVRIFNNII